MIYYVVHLYNMYQSYPFFLSHRHHWVPTPPRRISLGTAGKAYPAVKENLVALGSIKNGWWTESNHPNLRIPILKKQEKQTKLWDSLKHVIPKKFMAKQFIPIFSPTKHSHSAGESRLLQELSGAQCGNQACNRCHIICRNGLPIFHWFQGMPNGTFSGQLHSQRVHFRVTNVLNNLKYLSPIEHRVPNIIPLVSFGCQPCIVCLQVDEFPRTSVGTVHVRSLITVWSMLCHIRKVRVV